MLCQHSCHVLGKSSATVDVTGCSGFDCRSQPLLLYLQQKKKYRWPLTYTVYSSADSEGLYSPTSVLRFPELMLHYV